MIFDWDKYQKDKECSLITCDSDTLPHHVALSSSHVKPGVLCEINISGDKFWFGVVRLACGPLVEISYIQPRGGEDLTTWQLQPGQWVDSEKHGIYQYGYCQNIKSNILSPPAPSPEEDRDWYTWCQEVKIVAKYESLSVSYPPGAGLSLVSHVRPGHVFMLRDTCHTRQFWRVIVTENIGGILGLRYDSPGERLKTDEYILATDPRLQSCSSVNVSELFVPSQLCNLDLTEEQWTNFKQSFVENIGSSLLDSFREEVSLQKHGFEERMLLAVVDPESSEKFRVAIVDKVIDEFHFVISLLENSIVRILCNTNSDILVPISWAIEKKFMAKASLQNMSCSPLSKIAPKHLFKKMIKSDKNFQVGQWMEYCPNLRDKKFSICQVKSCFDNILTIDVWTEDGVMSKLSSVKSVHLFPTGFAEANNLKYSISNDLKEYYLNDEEADSNMETDETENNENEESIDFNTAKISEKSLSERFNHVSLSKPMLDNSSSWCPRIYFNHLCYSASFLSRHRLESLPRFIGSGPVRLVLREVLSRLIGASFKSGAVLKKLEIGEDRKRRPDYWLETMKGKSRVLVLQADVEIPSKSSQVAGFCREVCQKLSCCPYLFGPQLVGSECPSACNTRPKSDFHQADGDSSNKFVRRGRKGKKKQKVAKEEETGNEKEVDPGNGGNASGSESDSGSSPVTTNTTRDNSPSPDGDSSGGNKRKYGPKNWSDILPPSEIKTRGAKLPSFSRQLKVRPSKKDVEELEKLIASKCDPDSPPRPPSPKLLRSKATPTVKETEIIDDDTDAAFSIDALEDHLPLADSPDVWKINLNSNPMYWTPADVKKYLSSQTDVGHMAEKFFEEEVDGEAFMLMNLPTVLEHWSLSMAEAIKISRHVESVKLAFYKNFAFADYCNGVGRGG